MIAVLYKDQHVGTLQKLLRVWFEGSLSESSEDNESNTTPVRGCFCWGIKKPVGFFSAMNFS